MELVDKREYQKVLMKPTKDISKAISSSSNFFSAWDNNMWLISKLEQMEWVIFSTYSHTLWMNYCRKNFIKFCFWSCRDIIYSKKISTTSMFNGPQWPRQIPSNRRHSPLQRIHESSTTYMKSVNLQYNTLGRMDDGKNESSTKCLMFQVFIFFHNFLQNSFQKSFQFL